jgi:hypothetical protein
LANNIHSIIPVTVCVIHFQALPFDTFEEEQVVTYLRSSHPLPDVTLCRHKWLILFLLQRRRILDALRVRQGKHLLYSTLSFIFLSSR